MKRFGLRGFAIAVSVLVILSLCAWPGQEVSAQNRGGVLRVAMETNPPTLDPHMSTTFIVRELSNHVFETLLSIGQDYDVIPQLARDWEVSSDGKTYTFYLREGVRFHNGKELTAEDVKASIERFMRVGARAGDLRSIESIEVSDRYTVKIHLKEPLGAFPGVLANPVTMVAIMPKELVENATSELRVPNLIGTGPFYYAQWVPDQYVSLKRFEDYAVDDRPASGLGGQRIPYLDEVRIYFVLEASARMAGLEAGEYDFASALPWTAYDRVASNPALEPVIFRPYTQIILQLNQNHPPFDNLKARQAVQAGLDFDQVMRAVTQGRTQFYRVQPSYFFPEQGAWYSEAGKELYNQANLEKARRLLQESGYSGEPIVFLTNRDYDWMYRAALAVMPQLQAIGFNVDLRIVDWASQVAMQRDGRGGKGDFHIATNGVSTRAEPSAFNYLFQCGASWETYGYCDAEMDQYLMEGMQGRTTQDRKAAYDKVQQRFYETIPFIKVGDIFQLDAYRPERLKGFEMWFLRRFWNVWQ